MRDLNICNKEHLILALSQFGVEEIKGQQDNPTIINYIEEIGYGNHGYKDELAWCSVFMNWISFKCGLPMSNKLDAQSWLKVGHKVEIGNQEIGDVVIFWRGSPTSWKGHVGYYVGENETHVYTLGGNQSNRVQISEYSKKRVKGYRRLTSY